MSQLARKLTRRAPAVVAGGAGTVRMWFFKGHTTGIAARTEAEARERKQRGPDELEGSRAVIPGEFGLDGTTWSRLRLDGKTPGQSKHDKRGLGPKPKPETGSRS